MAAQTREILDQALRRLRPAHRRVFLLRQIEGLSTTETATLLGTTENTVKTHLRRARMSLQRTLTEELELAAE